MKQKINNNTLPKPASKYGYIREELMEICKARGITWDRFIKAFGVGNTCAVIDGIIYTYVIDVERALYKLKMSGGVYHEED